MRPTRAQLCARSKGTASLLLREGLLRGSQENREAKQQILSDSPKCWKRAKPGAEKA